MRRFSGALAFVAGAALIIGSTGTAIGQEDPPPEASMAPEAVVVEPSTLGILDIAADKLAIKPLRGEKLKKAVAKNAPKVTRYYVAGMGAHDMERIVQMSLQARALDEAGDTKAAKATLALATLLYRHAWSRAKTDPLALNDELESFIEAGDYGEMNAALTLFSEGADGFGDLCMSPGGFWFYNPLTPSLCADDGGGRMVRADYSFIDESAENGSMELYTGDPETADAGGLGIHKIVQHKTANDKLAGKKSKKAWTKALSKQGLTVVSLYAGGPDASPERQVIELVLAARAADEAGQPKAARAFMNLALATYRSALRKPEEGSFNNEALNGAIETLSRAEYADAAGLELFRPHGFESACYQPDGSTCELLTSNRSLWECDAAGLVFRRVPTEEAVADGCPAG